MTLVVKSIALALGEPGSLTRAVGPLSKVGSVGNLLVLNRTQEVELEFSLGVFVVGDRDYEPDGVGDGWPADNPVSAGSQALTIRVLHGSFGSCRVRLLDDAAEPSVREFFDGQVDIASGHFRVGGLPGETCFERELVPGAHRVRIYADDVAEATLVEVVI